MTSSETQQALDAFTDVMVEGAQRTWMKKHPKSVRDEARVRLDMKAALVALEEAGILVLPDEMAVEVELEEETVVPFTGRRKGPTIFDLGTLAEFFRDKANDAESGKFTGAGIVLVQPDHTSVIDWLLLPGVGRQDLTYGLDGLKHEILQQEASA